MAHASVGQLWSLQLFVSPMLGRKNQVTPEDLSPEKVPGEWALPCPVGWG